MTEPQQAHDPRLLRLVVRYTETFSEWERLLDQFAEAKLKLAKIREDYRADPRDITRAAMSFRDLEANLWAQTEKLAEIQVEILRAKQE